MMSCVLRNSGLSSIKFLCATLSHMSIDGKTIVDGKRVLTVDETAATQEATAICHKYLARQLGAQNQL